MTTRKKTESVVKQNITNALLEIMKEKPLKDISITELVSKAQVARVSFYRNYRDKEDVLRQTIHKKTETFLEFCSSDLPFEDPKSFVYLLFEYLRANNDLVSILDDANRMEIIREEFDFAFGVGCADKRESAKRSFVSGGLYNLFRRWVLSNYNPPADCIADFIVDLVQQGF